MRKYLGVGHSYFFQFLVNGSRFHMRERFRDECLYMLQRERNRKIDKGVRLIKFVGFYIAPDISYLPSKIHPHICVVYLFYSSWTCCTVLIFSKIASDKDKANCNWV